MEEQSVRPVRQLDWSGQVLDSSGAGVSHRAVD
jgi:hypothetical protein